MPDLRPEAKGSVDVAEAWTERFLSDWSIATAQYVDINTGEAIDL